MFLNKRIKSLDYVNKPNPESIDTLVFSGAGARGVIYAGMIQELDKRGVLKNVNHFAGSSAGSMIALVCALGYSPAKISEIVASTDFAAFLDTYICDLKEVIKNPKILLDPANWAGTLELIANLLTMKAVCPGSYAEKWIADRIIDVGFSAHITFAQLYKYTGKTLTVTTCDLGGSREMYCNHITSPDVRVLDAVRASMAIPFVFAPKDVFGRNCADNVDGGTTDNLPIVKAGKNFLAFTLVGKDDLLHPPVRKIETLIDVAEQIIGTLRSTMYNLIFSEQENIDRTVFCGAVPEVGALSFDEAEKRKVEMVAAGKQAIVDYFA